MNSNDKPGFQLPPESFDDVEGHSIRGRGLVEDETTEVEGHGFSGHVDGTDTDDVEGHMPRIRLPLEGPDTEDAEGHGARFNGMVEDTQDDVEGHMPRIRLAGEPPEDPEGQAEDTEGHGRNF